MLKTDPEQQLARDCNMTVIAEADASLHVDGEVRTKLRETFAYEGPYDLLSVPNLHLLLSHQDSVEVLASDVVATVDLHRVERALVLTRTMQAPHVVQRLREAQPKRLRHVQIAGSNLPTRRRDPVAPTLVVSCMDWRLHQKEGLKAAISATYGETRFELMATAGAAKELHNGARSAMAVRQIAELQSKGLKRVILVSHTDCGKYGGNDAFASSDHQHSQLCEDLSASVTALSTHFPALEVKVGYAQVSGHALKGITPV